MFLAKGDFREDSKQDLEGTCYQAQVWFSLYLKFNSLELDSEVGRLVVTVFLSISFHQKLVIKDECCSILQNLVDSLKLLEQLTMAKSHMWIKC